MPIGFFGYQIRKSGFENVLILCFVFITATLKLLDQNEEKVSSQE